MMYAIRISHVRADERRSQAALAQAVGAELYHDGAGNTFAVSPDGRHFAANKLTISRIPNGWLSGEANPIGGWESDR